MSSSNIILLLNPSLLDKSPTILLRFSVLKSPSGVDPYADITPSSPTIADGSIVVKYL